MSQFPPGASNPLPPSSPYGQDFGLEPERKSWPLTIGVISIVWGSLGVICNGCATVNNLGGSALQQWAQQHAPNPQVAQQMQNAPSASIGEMVVGMAGFIFSILLIVAGSLLVARKPQARPLHIVWAAVNLLLGIAGAVFGIDKVQAQIAQMQAQANAGNTPPPPGVAAGMQAGAYGMFACVVLVGLSYPVFILIWFLMVKRDSQEITQGLEEPAA